MKYFCVLFLILASSLYAQESTIQKRDSVNNDSAISSPKVNHYIFCDLAGLTLLDVAISYEAVLNNQFYARIGHYAGLLNLFFQPQSSGYKSLLPISLGYIFPTQSTWKVEVGMGSTVFVDWSQILSRDNNIYPAISFSIIPFAIIGGARFYPENSLWAFRFYGTVNYLSTKNIIPWFGVSAGIRL
jgi:hypothetical protein